MIFRLLYFPFFVFLIGIGNYPQANAALIAQEDFESYTAGNSLAGLNGGSGFTGAWASNSAGFTQQVASANLSYHNGEVFTPGGGLALALTSPDTNISEFASRGIGAQTDTLYMSFLYQPVVDAGSPNDDFLQIGFQNASLSNPTGSIIDEDGAFRVRAGTSGSLNTGIISGAGQTYFLVLRLEKTVGGAAYDRMTAFVNPTSLTETSNPFWVDNSTDVLDLSSDGFLNLRRARLDPGDQFLIDSFRIGTSFSDVVTPVPEPTTTLGLLALISGVFLKRRRRALG